MGLQFIRKRSYLYIINSPIFNLLLSINFIDWKVVVEPQFYNHFQNHNSDNKIIFNVCFYYQHTGVAAMDR